MSPGVTRPLGRTSCAILGLGLGLSRLVASLVAEALALPGTIPAAGIATEAP